MKTLKTPFLTINNNLIHLINELKHLANILKKK